MNELTADNHTSCCSEEHHEPAEPHAIPVEIAAAATNNQMLESTILKLDNLGMFASILCLIHCLAMPFVIALLPVMGLQFMETHESHVILGSLIWAFALFAIVPGYLKHRKLPILLGMGFGLGLVTLGVLAGHELFGEQGEMICLSIGNLTLVGVHWKNRGLCKCGTSCH